MDDRRRYFMGLLALTCACLLVGSVACRDRAHEATPGHGSPARTTPTTVGNPLPRAEACRRFESVLRDGTITSDRQSSVALGSLADQTTDPELAAAIQRLADRYAIGATAVSPSEVRALCA